MRDGNRVSTSIFNKVYDIVLSSDPLEKHQLDINYFGEIERQATEILTVFARASEASKNLAPVKDVVQFFYVTYLSRNPIEAISKLVKLHE